MFHQKTNINGRCQAIRQRHHGGVCVFVVKAIAKRDIEINFEPEDLGPSLVLQI